MKTQLAALFVSLAPPAAAQSWLNVEHWIGSEDHARLGNAVSVSGDTLAVGSYLESVGGVPFAGKVRVYVRSGTDWTEQAVLSAGSIYQARFGQAIHLQGDTLVVGAPLDFGTGRIHVFTRAGTVWTREDVFGAADSVLGDEFAASVHRSGDALVAGAPRVQHPSGEAEMGAAYVFRRSGTTWSEEAKLEASDKQAGDLFGRSVAMRADTVFAGAPAGWPNTPGAGIGAVYRFERELGDWVEKQILQPAAQDALGWSMDVEEDTLLVGASTALGGSGGVYVYLEGADGWLEDTVLSPADAAFGDQFGWSVDLSGGLACIGASYADVSAGPAQVGAAYVFERSGTVWSERMKTFSPVPEPFALFGDSVAISAETAFVGAQWESQNFTQVRGLAFDPGSNTLYGVDHDGRVLGAFDPATGVGREVGILFASQVEALAFDPNTGTLYAVEDANDTLLRIDTLTGVATTVGPVGYNRVYGLAYDPANDVLYGSDISTDVLITIDTATGAGTTVGGYGPDRLAALAFDPAGVLYAVDHTTQRLMTLDTATGKATNVGNFGISGVRGLAFDTGTGAVLGSQQFNLFSLDTASAAATLVGQLGPPFQSMGSLAIFEANTPAASYCTAGTSASGCRATLSATGLASATAASGFDVTASGVEGDKTGLFFFGTNGRQGNPWGSGTSYQCVAPPVVRAGSLPGSGTAGACDGSFAQDLNALWCATCPKPGHNPGLGAPVQLQLWYRDPLNTSNQTTGFSDALEFLLAP